MWLLLKCLLCSGDTGAPNITSHFHHRPMNRYTFRNKNVFIVYSCSSALATACPKRIVFKFCFSNLRDDPGGDNGTETRNIIRYVCVLDKLDYWSLGFIAEQSWCGTLYVLYFKLLRGRTRYSIPKVIVYLNLHLYPK